MGRNKGDAVCPAILICGGDGVIGCGFAAADESGELSTRNKKSHALAPERF